MTPAPMAEKEPQANIDCINYPIKARPENVGAFSHPAAGFQLWRLTSGGAKRF